MSDLCLTSSTQKVTPLGSLTGRFQPTNYLDTAGNFNPSQAGIGDHKIYYTVTDINNCSNTDSATIRVVGSPNASITPVSEMCENESPIILTGSINTGGQFNATY